MQDAAKLCDDTCEDCGGAGYTVQPKCCGRPGSDCCGQPVPEQVQCENWFHGLAAVIRNAAESPMNNSPTKEKQ
jgi:hypothetical protein